MMIMPVFIQMIEDPADQEWMAGLYTQYQKLMYATADYYLDDYYDIEEVINDGLLALYERIDLIRSLEAKALTSYIITTIRNTAFNCLRKKKLINRHFMYLSDYNAETVSATDDVERIAEARDQLDIVHRIINTLSEKEQAVIRLKFEIGLEDKEIAEILDISPENIRQIISRARKRIRDALHREEVRA